MKDIFNTELLRLGDNAVVYVYSLIYILFAAMVTWFAYRWTKKLTRTAVRSGRLDTGREFAITRITKYILILLFALVTLSSLNVNWKLFAVLAPLLIGIGLGLQQVANDLVSGFILLVEPTIRVNDIVEVDNIVAKVVEIGLRTSRVETRDGIAMIIPNHKLVSEKLINWSTSDNVTRFKINVGVAYGSDVELVKKILIECAWKHTKVITNPAPEVFFKLFGDSSLNFELAFWSSDLYRIEIVKSDLRFMINQAFKDNNVTIPFPQRDLHIYKNDGTLS